MGVANLQAEWISKKNVRIAVRPLVGNLAGYGYGAYYMTADGAPDHIVPAVGASTSEATVRKWMGEYAYKHGWETVWVEPVYTARELCLE